MLKAKRARLQHCVETSAGCWTADEWLRITPPRITSLATLSRPAKSETDLGVLQTWFICSSVFGIFSLSSLLWNSSYLCNLNQRLVDKDKKKIVEVAFLSFLNSPKCVWTSPTRLETNGLSALEMISTTIDGFDNYWQFQQFSIDGNTYHWQRWCQRLQCRRRHCRHRQRRRRQRQQPSLTAPTSTTFIDGADVDSHQQQCQLHFQALWQLRRLLIPNQRRFLFLMEWLWLLT